MRSSHSLYSRLIRRGAKRNRLPRGKKKSPSLSIVKKRRSRYPSPETFERNVYYQHTKLAGFPKGFPDKAWMEALTEVLNNVDSTPTEAGSNTRQVKFAPEPVMISSADITTTSDSINSLFGLSSTITTTCTVQSPLRSGSKVKGTIAVTDFSDPNKVNKVLVSSVLPTGGTSDHTYATKEKEVTSSSEESTSSSDNEKEGVAMATPINSQKPKSTSSTTKTRGRPKKNQNASETIPTGITAPLKSILKTTPLSCDAKLTYEKVKRRGRGCGNCSGCLREDCGTCCYCLDKPKFGGPGKKKQRCALRVCANFVSIKSTPTARNIASSQQSKSSVVSEAMRILSKMNNTSIGTSPANITPASLPPIKTDAASTKVVQSTNPGDLTSLATSMVITGATPTSRGPQSATFSNVRTGKQNTGSGLETNAIKCVVCGRERKANQSRSNKFCGGKCMKDWEILNPGKDPETAEPLDNVNIPLLLQAAAQESKQVLLPRALRNLQIDMALPGERRHSLTNSQDLLDSGPLIQSILGNTSLSDSSPLSPPMISGIKRTNQDTTSITTPTKRSKIITSSVTSPVTSPTATKQTKKLKNNQDVSKWSIADVVKYFDSTDCSHIATVFREQEVDGEALLLLSHDSLVKCLGIKLGPALKVMTHVDRLKLQASLF